MANLRAHTLGLYKTTSLLARKEARMSRVWWCNQGQCGDDEGRAGVVCAAQAENSSGQKYRETVERARKGNIIAHYETSHNKSILAISQAKTDGVKRVIS